jgi:hypothetical protein
MAATAPGAIGQPPCGSVGTVCAPAGRSKIADIAAANPMPKQVRDNDMFAPSFYVKE